MPVYLFSGEEEFNIENAVQNLRKQFLDPNWASLNHKVLIEPDLPDLIEALQTIPMVFGDILIEVKSSNLFIRGSKKVLSSDKLMTKLFEALEDLNSNIHVLFVCQIPRDSGKKVDSAAKLTKLIEKIGKIETFNSFKLYQEKELVSWITQRAGTKEIKISSDAAMVLLQNTGSELRKLDSELEKLKLSVSPKNMINKNDVLALCSTHENIFLLADCWLKKDRAKAIIELHKLFEKDHPLKIIATLQSVLRRWLKIKIESKTKNSFEISRIINLHKFVIEQDIKKLKGTSLEELIELKNKLTQAENKIKSGKLSAEMSLELAIAS
jgi:DNA polymerase-3 subunit delta